MTGSEERCNVSLSRLQFGLFDLCRFVVHSDSALFATSRRFLDFGWQTAWPASSDVGALHRAFLDGLQRQVARARR